MSGGAHEIYAGCANPHVQIINSSEPLALEGATAFLLDRRYGMEAVLITNEAFTNATMQDGRALTSLLAAGQEMGRPNMSIMILTTEDRKSTLLAEGDHRMSHVTFLVTDLPRLPAHLLQEAFDALRKESTRATVRPEQPASKPPGVGKKSFLERFLTRSKTEAAGEGKDEWSKGFAAISKGTSRVIAITGHRGSGLTSTAVNIAHEANKRGLSAILVDLDTDYRSTNLYCNDFYEMAKNADVRRGADSCLQHGLLHTLRHRLLNSAMSGWMSYPTTVNTGST